MHPHILEFIAQKTSLPVEELAGIYQDLLPEYANGYTVEGAQLAALTAMECAYRDVVSQREFDMAAFLVNLEKWKEAERTWRNEVDAIAGQTVEKALAAALQVGVNELNYLDETLAVGEIRREADPEKQSQLRLALDLHTELARIGIEERGYTPERAELDALRAILSNLGKVNPLSTESLEYDYDQARTRYEATVPDRLARLVDDPARPSAVASGANITIAGISAGAQRAELVGTGRA